MQTSSSLSPSTVKFSPNCPWTKSLRPSSLLPVAVGVELVDEDGSLLAAVPGEITLAVAVDVEPAAPGGGP